MTRVNFSDTYVLDGFKETAEGYVLAMPRVARTGVQVYSGRDLGITDRQTVRVYRPESEVFSVASMKSYAHRPITLGHPRDSVNAENWSQLAVGMTGEEVVRDGDFVRVPTMLMDARAKAAMNAGINELSMGYSASLEFVDGVTSKGEAYDAICKDLRMNHLAIVPNARGGSELKLGDEKQEKPMADPIKTRTVLVDGLPFELSDTAAAAIDKLLAARDAAVTKLTDAESKHARELAERDAQIDDLKKKVLSDEDMAKQVTARAAMLAAVKAVAPALIVDGKTDVEIRRMTVHAKFGDAATVGKSDDYVAARFDLLVEDAMKRNPVRESIMGIQTVQHDGADPAQAAHVKMQDRLANAWKSPVSKEQ